MGRRMGYTGAAMLRPYRAPTAPTYGFRAIIFLVYRCPSTMSW